MWNKKNDCAASKLHSLASCTLHSFQYYAESKEPYIIIALYFLPADVTSRSKYKER